MTELLEISGADISQLNDTDLRSLVSLLCEADYRLHRLSTRGILWGGNQDESDGGLDVIVRDSVFPPNNSFIKEKVTGFQVKKPKMNPARIIDEMRPNGALRDEIKKLIKEEGAYIIVSSGDSLTPKSYGKRLAAMEQAIEDEPDFQKLKLDFYDCGRIASWVRMHPSLILWVRKKTGKSLNGWQPFDSWSNKSGTISDDYILDPGIRIRDGITGAESTALDGLNSIRNELNKKQSSVRIAGLSGVGKTRFVEALFDERIGNGALGQDLVYYTDISDNPSPDPVSMIGQLLAFNTRAILVVDNCNRELHKRLTDHCKSKNSQISLLTVEYDVRDDVPNETQVFYMEPAGKEVIQKLIRVRFPYIDLISVDLIAEFSGGNARIALGIAGTVKRGETLSGFRDEDLFNRLFFQGQPVDNDLRISAEVCSLVYSFNCNDIETEHSELKTLSLFLGKTANELFRHISTLEKRQLIQSRGEWRAILPHAIANKLAKDALNSVPLSTIEEVLLKPGNERLIKVN